MSQDAVKVFASLADTTRLEIVKNLARKKEVSCQNLMKSFSLSQPTLSHHFKKLSDAGILRVRKDGKSHFYSIDKALLKKLGIDIKRLKNQ